MKNGPNAKFPRTMPGIHTTARKRPGFVGKICAGGCGTLFGRSSKIVVVETQVNWFRGDDECVAYCPDCFAKKEEPKS
jgi:hypothetical protein